MSPANAIRARRRQADAAQLTRLQWLYAGDQAVQQLIEPEHPRRTLHPLVP